MRVRTTIAVASSTAALALGVGGTPSAADSSCPAVGAVGIVLPHQQPLVLKEARDLASARIAYPADGSVFTASSLVLNSPCTSARPVAGTARVTSISLFGGEVTADAATLDLTGGGASATGLHADGHPVQLAGDHATDLGDWGYLTAPDPTASYHGAFEIELERGRDGLPAGTLIFVPYAQIKLAPALPETTTEAVPPLPGVPLLPGSPGGPLTVTPPLHGGPYTFPVAGKPEFADTYGAFRADVPGGWHHGDDLFAPIGTPVVAVASGTLNRVGWEQEGGWRLWVRDRNGDEFYYAHLSGYSPQAKSGAHVHRGEILGFVGNTGDAFTTEPHLHFEIHPRKLLHLQYNGAVDPTTYLESWPSSGRLVSPLAVHPPLPAGSEPRFEAKQNWRELESAQHAGERRIEAASLLHPGVVSLVERTTTAFAPPADGEQKLYAWAGINAVVAVALLALVMWRRTRHLDEPLEIPAKPW